MENKKQKRKEYPVIINIPVSTEMAERIADLQKERLTGTDQISRATIVRELIEESLKKK